MSNTKNYREVSRFNFGKLSDGESVSIEELQIGCMQRIADASELMSKNYLQMQSDMDWFRRKLQQERDDNKRMARRIAAYQGIIKKLKKHGKN